MFKIKKDALNLFPSSKRLCFMFCSIHGYFGLSIPDLKKIKKIFRTPGSNITKIHMNKENRIHTIRLNLSDARKAPEINYENLTDCKILVPENQIEEFTKRYWNDIKRFRNPYCINREPIAHVYGEVRQYDRSEWFHASYPASDGKQDSDKSRKFIRG